MEPDSRRRGRLYRSREGGYRRWTHCHRYFGPRSL